MKHIIATMKRMKLDSAQIISCPKRLLRGPYMSFRKGRVRAALHWLLNGHLARRLKISKLLEQKHTIRLQLGGGYYQINGWLNGDLIGGDIYVDATCRLPLPNESVDRVFTEHFIEHLTYEDAKNLMNDIFRTMIPGGRIRFATPDLERIIMLYEERNPYVSINQAVKRHSQNHRRTVPNKAHLVNDLFRLWGHKFIYDFDALKHLFESCGFEDVERHTFGCSNDASFKNLERHADIEWMKHGIQLIVEATKPEMVGYV